MPGEMSFPTAVFSPPTPQYSQEHTRRDAGNSPQRSPKSSSTTERQNSPSKSAVNWWKNLKGSAISEEPLATFGRRPALERSAVSSHAVPGFMTNSRFPNGLTADGVPLQYQDSPIFGVPLDVSLRYAGVRISLVDREGDRFAYGSVPVIIAKCALFLKQNARQTEGIFRIPGSVRRIRMLQDLFSTPPLFGKKLDWSGFTVHDAANLLKRYLSCLPEPVISQTFYQKFRDPLQRQFASIKHIAGQYSTYSASQENYDKQTISSETSSKPELSSDEFQLLEEAVTYYERLIHSLPIASAQLLLYLIDLLSVFAAESEQNRMSAYNLSAIFQPSVLTVTEHDMNPGESEISRQALQFLVEVSTPLLERVQKKAIEQHELAKRGLASGLPAETSKTISQNPLTNEPPALSSDSQPTAVEASRPQLFVSHFTSPNDVNSNGQNFEDRNRLGRRHSKSVSSAQPPPIFAFSDTQNGSTNRELLSPFKEELPKFPGFLRRQLSTRRSRTNSRSASDDSSDQGNDDGERKSRFRRSLMVLLPNRNPSRSPSPAS